MEHHRDQRSGLWRELLLFDNRRAHQPAAAGRVALPCTAIQGRKSPRPLQLLEQVADSIWVCDNKTITPWKGSIQDYKKHLRKQQEAQAGKMFSGAQGA